MSIPTLSPEMRQKRVSWNTNEDNDRLWLLTKDELEVAARLGIPIESIFDEKITIYTGNIDSERTGTVTLVTGTHPGSQVRVTSYGVRESVISGLPSRSERDNAGMVLRAAFEFISEVAERIESKRNWDLLPEGRSSVVIDLEGCRDIARSADSGIAQAIIVLQSAAPFIVESMRQALVDHHEHGTPVSDQMLKLAADILRVRHNTEDAR